MTRAKRQVKESSNRKSESDKRDAPGFDLASLAWYLAVIPSFLSFGYTMMRGSDLWWHLATGRLIVEQKFLPTIDSWSYTRYGQPWLQHEWLSDVFFHLWATMFGMNALVYWKWLLLILTFVLLFHVVRMFTADAVSSYAGVLLAIATAAPFLDIRPHLYSALGFVVIIYLVLRRDQPPIWLPLIFLVWVNLHGGFFFGLMTLFVLLLPAVLYGKRTQRRRVSLIWLACVLICVLNPNGIKAFYYPLKYAFDSSSPFTRLIGEWASPFVSGGIQSRFYLVCIGVFLAAAIVLLVIRTERKQRTNWSLLALGLLTLAMSLTSRRFIVLFAISQSLVTGKALALLLATRLKSLPPLLAPVITAILGLFWLYPYPISPYTFHYLTAEDEFPIETCNFIEVNQLSGNVFDYYNWGGYLHLRTNGRMKVYIDGRADTVFDDANVLNYAYVQGFRPGWEKIVEESGAQYILWPRNEQGRPLSQLISGGRWRILYGDFVSVLLVRIDREPPGPLKPTPNSAFYQLTLGVHSLEQGKPDVAEGHFRNALGMMPHLRTACYSLAQAQAKQGKKNEAQQQLESCLRVFPDSEKFESVNQLLK